MDDNANAPIPAGPNKTLPPLNPFFARSTIAAVLTVLTAISPLLGETGAASLATEIVANGDAIQGGVEQIVRTVDVLIGVLAPVWFWLERRAPQARLSFSRR